MDIKLYQRGGDRTNFELYKKAIQFYADELIPKTKQKKLKIILRFKKYKTMDDCGYMYEIAPNHYKISINKELHFPYIISTLAHEMVHVKQGVMGALRLNKIGFVWKGKMHKNIDNMKPEEVEKYNSMPWEKEAFQLEQELTKKFFKVVLNEIKE